jgi:transcriptional regulator with XRE-family HTH domain
MSPAKTDILWFQNQCKKNGITQRALARALKTDPPCVSRLIHGRQKITLNQATIISQVFHCPLDDVLVAAGIKPPTLPTKETLEIKGWIGSDHKVHWGAPKGPRTAPKPSFVGRNVGVVRYQTLGSGLETMDGVFVYYQESSASGLSPDCIGRMCLVQGLPKSVAEAGGAVGKDEYWYVATIKRGYSPGGYNLASIDGRMIAEDVAVERAWPVVWIKMV